MLEGMSVVITGGARGIGASTALMVASRGGRVTISDVDDREGQQVVAEIQAAGGHAAYQHCDITDAEEVKALMAFAAETHGGIDVVHNNAGVHESMLAEDCSIENMADDVWDKVLAINLRGPWLCSKYAVPYLKESSYASIINAGSNASFTGASGNLAYGPSKTGIVGLTRNLAVDLARYSIRVNCYCPSNIRTRMTEEYINSSGDPNAMFNLTKTHLIPRLGEPDEIAELVCYLASRQSSFVNGAIWLIDGGQLTWRGTADSLGLQSA